MKSQQLHMAQVILTRWPERALLTFVTALVALTGCGPEAAQPVRAEAEALYLDGLEHLHGGALLEAEQELQKLTKLPSYVTLTALARLRLADAHFQARKYDEAIEAYNAFIRRHENNENVPYAMFMIAKANYELAPSDLFFMPPVYELDLTPVQQARAELEKFIRTYPRSRLATEALALRDRCIDLQYAHARYVIDFYAQRKQWIGVVYQLHLAMQAFATRAHTADHYALLAKAYEQLLWRGRAVELWQAIARRWPGTALASEAPAHIRAMQEAIQSAKQRGEPGEMPVDAPPTAAIKPETVGEGGEA